MRTRLTSWKHVADLSSLGLHYTLSLSVVIAVYVSEKNMSTLLLIPTKYFTRGPVIRTRVAGVPSQWHNPWNWKCAFINFSKVGMQFVFLICHHLFRVDLPKGITTTLRNWPLARNEDGWKQLTYLIFPWTQWKCRHDFDSCCLDILIFIQKFTPPPALFILFFFIKWMGRAAFRIPFQWKDAKWDQTEKLACWSSKSKPSRWGCLVDLHPGAPGFQSLAGLSHLSVRGFLFTTGILGGW